MVSIKATKKHKIAYPNEKTFTKVMDYIFSVQDEFFLAKEEEFNLKKRLLNASIYKRKMQQKMDYAYSTLQQFRGKNF